MVDALRYFGLNLRREHTEAAQIFLVVTKHVGMFLARAISYNSLKFAFVPRNKELGGQRGLVFRKVAHNRQQLANLVLEVCS